MFEKYTEKARRTIFFARYEAAQAGSPTIEGAHLVLGLVRESPSTWGRVSTADDATIRRVLHFRNPAGAKPLTTSVDLPLSHAAKRMLSFAAEESERMGHGHIGTEHLLLGVLREEGPEASALAALGVELDTARRAFANAAADPPANRVPEERLGAAERIFEALRAPNCRITVESPAGHFDFTFGEKRGGQDAEKPGND